MRITTPSLRDFQVTGAKFLAARRSALLADEMGLGKSVEAIAALDLLAKRNQLRRALVVAPGYLISNWASEFEKWSTRWWIEEVRGTKAQRSRLWRTDATVFVASYDSLSSDISIAGTRPYDIVIFDEAQKIKSRQTRIHKAASDLRAYRWWALTGTPVENSFEEYKAIFDVIAPSLLTTETNLEPWRQRDMMGERTLRRTRDDVLDLPALVEEQVWLTLGPQQQIQYDSVFAQTALTLRNHPTTAHALAMLAKLLQICSIDPESGESTKLDYLISVLKELENTDSGVLVFSYLPQKVLKQIAPKLKWCKPLLITGETPINERDQLIREFQESRGLAVALISTKAGGLGLNLTRANYIFHFDHWWTPAAKDQADARAYRMGQEKTVFSYSLFTSRTVEELVAKLLGEKRHLFSSVLTGNGPTIDGEVAHELLGIVAGMQNK